MDKQQRKAQQWEQKQPKREYKLFVGSMKATNDDQGIIEGILNAIGNIDYGDDRTLAGAFKRTLTNSFERKKNDGDDYLWPYLWNHNYEIVPPGGIFDADEVKAQGKNPPGLFIKSQLNLEYDLARDMYSSFKAGTLKKQSMGYIAHQTEYVKEDGRMIRNLIEVEVLEGSAVVFPMNDQANVTGVKRTQSGLYVPKYWQGWNNTMDKKQQKPVERKDFNDHYREEVIEDWLSTDFWNITCALKKACMDMFSIGDSPQTDVDDTVLNDGDNSAGFITALKAWVQKGIDIGVSDYLNEMQQSNPYGYNDYYAYMSRSIVPDRKAHKSGAAFSQSNTDAVYQHMANLHAMADAQAKSMHDAADGLQEALNGLGTPSNPSWREQGTTSDDEKSRRRFPARVKASETDRQVIGQHATDLHGIADTIHQMAEDLAENTGAQTYVDSSGNADDAKETDKSASRSDVRGKHSPHSTADSSENLDDLLSGIRNLHKTL